MPTIAPNSIVDPQAELDADVEIGPFCTVGPGVRIGAGTRLISHVVVTGRTRIGARNVIHPFAVIGNYPQDLKYKGEPTGVEVGNDNQIREHVTIHAGTVYGSKVNGGGITRVGDSNLMMVNAHVGHDCQVGSRCIIANNVMLAGHVVVGNNVVLNGLVGVNAWVTIGDFAYIGGAARIHHDVPPFVKVSDKDCIRAVNDVGLRRAGFSDDDIAALDDAARRLFASKRPLAATMREFDTANGINGHVKTMIEFLRRRDSGKFGALPGELKVARTPVAPAAPGLAIESLHRGNLIQAQDGKPIRFRKAVHELRLPLGQKPRQYDVKRLPAGRG